MSRRWLRVAALTMVLSTFAAAISQAVESTDPAESNQSNRLTDAEKAAGWKLLFDGKTTSGWRNYGKQTISDGWKVADGVLSAKHGGGDIISTDEFGAFELVLDYKISKGGNSGVMFHVVEEGRFPYETGPEVQIYDDHGEPGAQKTGFLYQMYGSEFDATKPAGEWNQLRILITPQKCETSINGKKYHEYVIGSDDWNLRAAKGKFNQFPHFGKRNRGHICLQEHGGEVAFKNIKIRPIGDEKP